MRNKKSFSSKVSLVLLIVLVPVMFYLMIDVGSAQSILEVYDSMKKESASNFPKTMIFLQTYTKSTGDLSLGQALGLPDEELEQIVNEGGYGDTPTDGSDVSHIPSRVSEYTEAKWREALSKSSPSTYFSIGTSSGGYRIQTFDGVDYLEEVQGRGYWKGIPNGDTTLEGVACWLYAQANAANALNGTTYSIYDSLMGREYSISWNASTNLWKHSGTNPRVGQDPAVDGPVWDSMGCKAEVLSTSKMSAEQLYSQLEGMGFNNCVYIVYGHVKGKVCAANGQGDHWLVVIGLTGGSNKGFKFLGNSSRSNTMSVNDIGSSQSAFDRIIRITPK